MATVPSPRTWTVGELLTAAKLNTDLRDGLNFLLAPPLAQLRKSGNQTGIASGSTTLITWDVEDVDRDNGHSNVTNNTRYTAQTAGYYDLSTTITFDSISGNQYRLALFRKNGTISLEQGNQGSTGSSSFVARITSATLMFLAVGDYVEVGVNHDNASSLSTFQVNKDPRMDIRWAST